MTGIWYRHDVEVGQLYYAQSPDGIYPRDRIYRVVGIVDQPAVILEPLHGSGTFTLVITSQAFAEYRRLEKIRPS